jgi:hypothetical protein
VLGVAVLSYLAVPHRCYLFGMLSFRKLRRAEKLKAKLEVLSWPLCGRAVCLTCTELPSKPGLAGEASSLFISVPGEPLYELQTTVQSAIALQLALSAGSLLQCLCSSAYSHRIILDPLDVKYILGREVDLIS